MRIKLFFIILSLALSACGQSGEGQNQNAEKRIILKNDVGAGIKCSENGCDGSYSGPEFVNGSDIAHQFSNKMSKVVGDKLKELYYAKEYKKVDFSKIKMTTEGMGSGNVVYKLSIPFVTVAEKCDAYTSFDHVGGWNHAPALPERKLQLSNVLMEGQELAISNLKTTPEGLQEYWIQWKNKNVQSDCE